MKEYLYRGIDKKHRKFVEGSLVVAKNGSCFITELFEIDMDCWLYWEVIPDTVGQYTGLTDRNGKKIFEYDIVKRYVEPFKSEDTYIVEYEPERCSFVLKNDFHQFLFDSKQTFQDGRCRVECNLKFEVVGNKFDETKNRCGKCRWCRPLGLGYWCDKVERWVSAIFTCKFYEVCSPSLK